MELTKCELEIMDVLWEAGKPMARSDLLAYPEEKSWKDSSVHILLNGLLQKGAIIEAGVVKRSKTYGRVFLPALTREEYYVTNLYSRRYKPDLIKLLDSLLSREEITTQDLDNVAQLVAKKNQEKAQNAQSD